MDRLFSARKMEVFLLSGIIGIVFYAIFGGDLDQDQSKFFYVTIGYPVWVILRALYWKHRRDNMIRLFKDNIARYTREIESLRQIDEDRAENIEFEVMNNFYNSTF